MPGFAIARLTKVTPCHPLPNKYFEYDTVTYA
jgi:hypothetical protein